MWQHLLRVTLCALPSSTVWKERFSLFPPPVCLGMAAARQAALGATS